MHGIIPETLLFLVLFSSLVSSHGTVDASVSATEWSKLSQVSLSQNNVYQHQNITHNGDLLISNNDAVTITNSTFYMNGTITIKDTSTLTITDSNFTASPRGRDAIILEDNASLIIISTALIFRPQGDDRCEIEAKANSNILMSNSKTQNQGYLVAFNNSEIYVNNSTLINGTTFNISDPSGVATFDNSTSTIENSTMNGVFVWNDSKASVSNSTVGIVRTGYEPSARTTINLAHSKINWIEISDGFADVYIENSLVNGASANSGKMTFIDSSYGTISASEGASVFVGWRLPLLGLLIIPYAWIPIIQIGTALLIIAAIIIVWVAWRRKRRQSQEQPSLPSRVVEP